MTVIGEISELWRYPVSSTGGERLDAGCGFRLGIGERGDRSRLAVNHQDAAGVLLRDIPAHRPAHDAEPDEANRSIFCHRINPSTCRR